MQIPIRENGKQIQVNMLTAGRLSSPGERRSLGAEHVYVEFVGTALYWEIPTNLARTRTKEHRNEALMRRKEAGVETRPVSAARVRSG